MMKQITLIFLALLIAALPFSGQAQYQFYTSSTGASGSLTVTGTTIVNQYYQVTGLTQISSSNNYQVTCAGGFSGVPGQRVLLIEMNGSSHTGRWEIDTVQTSGNPCTIVSTLAVSFDPAASSTIQLITIPQYVDLTIANNGVLTAAPYNDTTGGVLVFEVEDTFTIVSGGRCDVSGLGFKYTPSNVGTAGWPGYGAAGGAAGSGGAAGIIGGPGGGGPFAGDTQLIQCSAVGLGGNGSVYGTFGSGMGLSGGAGGGNNSIMGTSPQGTTLCMGTAGQVGSGGWGGYGAGGGGGGGGGAGAQPGTGGGTGGWGGGGGAGGTGGGILIFYSNVLIMPHGVVSINASGNNGSRGGNGSNGGRGGNGGEGAGSCNGGGGGDGAQGGNGAQGGGGGGGGAVYRILKVSCPSYSDTTVILNGGAGGLGGSGGYGGAGGLNADTSCTNTTCSGGGGGGGGGSRTVAQSGPNGSGGGGAAAGAAGSGGGAAGSGGGGSDSTFIDCSSNPITGTNNLVENVPYCGFTSFDPSNLYVSGGSGNYTYNVQAVGGASCGVDYTSWYGYIQNYVVQVTDGNGCTASFNAQINYQDDQYYLIEDGQTNTSCPNSCDGSYTYDIGDGGDYSGCEGWGVYIYGPNNFQYMLPGSASTSYSITITGLCAGAYSGQLNTDALCNGLDDNFNFTIGSNNTPVFGHQSVTICSSASYTWNGNSYTQSGIYSDTLHGAAVGGCDSIANLNLTVYSGISITVYDTILSGQSIHIGTNSYSQAGSYIDTLTGVHGCDSIIHLYLALDTPAYVTLFDTICQGSSVILGGHTYIHSGTYSDTLTHSTGDDSIVTLHLYLINIISTNVYDTICPGSSFLFAGHNLTTQGIYRDTLSSALGCDSTVTLHLTLYHTITSLYDTICAGSSFAFGGHSYSQTGIYLDTLTSIHGCDSTIIMHLRVKQPSYQTIDTMLCGGSIQIGDYIYSTSGTYIDTIPDLWGCDSIITLNLTVIPAITASNSGPQIVGDNCGAPSFDPLSLGVSGGAGSYNYTVNPGTAFCSAIGYDQPYNTVVTDSLGCQAQFNTDFILQDDSFVVTSLIVTNAICQDSGSCFFTLSGSGLECNPTWNLSIAGTNTGYYNSFSGSRLIDTINVTGLPTDSFSYYLSGSNVCSPYIFGSFAISQLQYFSTTQYDTLCEGSPYVFGNQTYDTSGIYIDTIHSALGCDTLNTLFLTILTNDTPSVIISLSHGPLLAGIQTDTFTATYSQCNNPTYSWYKDTTPLGIHSPIAIISYQAGTHDSILCRVDCSNRCTSIGYTFSNSIFTAVDQISFIQAVAIYPNPTNGSFTMDINAATISNKDAQISVTDLIGQTILSEPLVLHSGYNKAEVSLGESAVSGVYIVQLTVDGQSLYYRIVLNK